MLTKILNIKPALIHHANAHIDNVNMLMFIIFV